MLVISGMAAGIGGMFRAPLGAALFAVEVLYSENEYESEALIPAIISSIVAYVVNAMLTGWEPIFAAKIVRASSARRSSLAYLMLGIVLAAIGRVYVKTFYGMRDRVFRPLAGAVDRQAGHRRILMVALIALWLAAGDGWRLRLAAADARRAAAAAASCCC